MADGRVLICVLTLVGSGAGLQLSKPYGARPSVPLRTTALPLRVAGPSMGLLSRFRFRPKRKLEAPAQITVGTALPNVQVEVVPRRLLVEAGEDGDAAPEVPAEIPVLPISEVLGKGKSFLVGMPGAFTPICTDVHLPGILRAAGELARYNVSKIAVVTTNDRYVMDAWRDALKSCIGKDAVDSENVVMLSDGDGDLVRALGLVDDMGFSVGVRSKRFALLCEDGVVTNVAVDEGMDELFQASAEKMLALVKPPEEYSPSMSPLDYQQIRLLFVAAAGLAVIALAVNGFSGDGLTQVAQTTTTSSGYQSLPLRR